MYSDFIYQLSSFIKTEAAFYDSYQDKILTRKLYLYFVKEVDKKEVIYSLS